MCQQVRELDGTQGRPSNRDVVIKKIGHIAPPPRPVLDEVVAYHLPPGSPITLSDIECLVCLGVLARPIQLPCGEVCCMSCLSEWVKANPTIDPLTCPCCPLTLEVEISKLHPASQVVLKLLDTLLVTCKRCGQRVTVAQHQEHLESSCTLQANTSVPETIDDILAQPSTTPLAPGERRAKQHSLVRLFSSSPPEEQVVSVPTSGRVGPAEKVNNILYIALPFRSQ